jgi:hypothetical protein
VSDIDFAQSLLKLNLSYLTHFHLRYQALDPLNHEIATGIVANHQLNPTTDELSLALFALSQAPSLVEFDLYDGPVVVSPCILWPDPHSDPSTLPVWPSLKHYRIELNIVQADGEWYFDGEIDPSRRHRTPTKHFHAFMMAIARACGQMPKLQTFHLKTNSEMSGGAFVEVLCDGTTSPREWVIKSAIEVNFELPQDIIDALDASAGGKDTIVWKKS